MNRVTAARTMRSIIELNGNLNAVAHVIERIRDTDEKKKFRRAFASIAGDVYTELMMPITEQFPDLDPDKSD